jgi:hypothetical protein
MRMVMRQEFITNGDIMGLSDISGIMEGRKDNSNESVVWG